jgi:cellulose synthase/poly-beta-1,6-N-acetylglucosamine synthase-like glycosyltransferase
MAEANDYYLKVNKASDLKNLKERLLFRSFEIFPGLLSWTALFLVVFLSWYRPLWIAIFIIIFVILWLFRTIYFSFHLWSGYQKMAASEKINWLERVKNLPNWQNVYHLIVIPMCREPLELVRDTFRKLEKTDYPKDKMLIILGCEERYKNSTLETSREIEKEFGKKFARFLIAWHPQNLAGEIAGKGSNETWAAKKAKEKIVDPLGLAYQNVIFSSFDVDSCVFPKYFSCLTYQYLVAKNPTRTSFQPIPLFINNIWQAPIISRVFSFSSTFWHSMNQERPEKLVTFSSHSMSFKALVEVGFKQTNVVSDDSRIFWQCFLKYNGDYQVQPLYYPISMDANVAKNFFRTLLNIFKQQRRWAYGVGDIAYFLFGFYKNKKIPFWKKFSLAFELIEGHFSWATASILIFLLGWLPLILGGPEFSQTIMSYSLPKIISRVMTLAMISLVSSAYLSLILLPPKPPEYGRYKYLVFAFSWLLFPIMMVFFTALPALDAQTRWLFAKYMGFWVTEKVRK